MNLKITSKAKLNNGVEIPLFGLGVYEIAKGKTTRNAIEHALDAGYRHFDTAKLYGNEKSLGKAIRQSSISRAEIFVTTKLWNSDHGYDSTLLAFESSLKRLDIGYIDLYLVHWPVQDKRLQSWRAMETLLESGTCRAIGVSNYMIRHLEELLAVCKIKPAVNQIELSPYNYLLSRKSVVDFCQENEIQVESYSPLTKGQRLRDPKLLRIAERYGKSPAQILIRWTLQHEIVVIPKSVKKERIIENANVFDFEILEEDMRYLNDLDENLVIQLGSDKCAVAQFRDLE